MANRLATRRSVQRRCVVRISEEADEGDEANEESEEAKEDDGVDTASLGSPHLHLWKGFIRALLASTEAGYDRDLLLRYWKEHIMALDLQDLAKDVEYSRVRVPQGKENNNSKRMEGKVRLQWALSNSDMANELDKVLRSQINRMGGEITFGAAPRGAWERDARALYNKLE